MSAVRLSIATCLARLRPLRQPVQHRGGVGGVADEQILAVAQVVEDHVVQDAPSLKADQRVAGVSWVNFGDIAGKDALQQVAAAGAAEVEPAHVGHVENPGLPAHGVVLPNNALVLHGHVPSGKRHHTAAQGQVFLVETGGKQVLSHGTTPDGSAADERPQSRPCPLLKRRLRLPPALRW